MTERSSHHLLGVAHDLVHIRFDTIQESVFLEKCDRTLTVTLARVISTCSEYVPGYMKIVTALVPEGRAATALVRDAYSLDDVVPERTMKAPVGGVVREEGGESEKTARGRRDITVRIENMFTRHQYGENDR